MTLGLLMRLAISRVEFIKKFTLRFLCVSQVRFRSLRFLIRVSSQIQVRSIQR
jgi:hypothetical protein